MSDRIHDDEPDTTETTVRALLSAQCPRWADLPLTYLRTSGTDNAMWRVHVPAGEDVVVRLPRRARAAADVGQEVDVLRSIANGTLATVVDTPRVLQVGTPTDEFRIVGPFSAGWTESTRGPPGDRSPPGWKLLPSVLPTRCRRSAT